MTEHIITRHKLKDVPLVDDFEKILDMCTLSDEEKDILRLHYLKDKDFRYIGDMLGYAERTIKTKHKKALRKVAKAL